MSEKLQVTKLSDIELNSRSVTRYKNIDTKLTDTTTTTSEEIMTTEIMLKKTGFWDDFDIFTEGGQLKVNNFLNIISLTLKFPKVEAEISGKNSWY